MPQISLTYPIYLIFSAILVHYLFSLDHQLISGALVPQNSLLDNLDGLKIRDFPCIFLFQSFFLFFHLVFPLDVILTKDNQHLVERSPSWFPMFSYTKDIKIRPAFHPLSLVPSPSTNTYTAC